MYSKPFERQPQVVDLTTTRADLSFQDTLILARLGDAKIAGFRQGWATLKDRSAIDVKLFDGLQLVIHDSLHPVADRWKSFQETAQAYAYQRIEWAVSWIETVGQPQGFRVHIVEVRDCMGETAMLLPMCWKRAGNAYVAHFIGEDMFDYLGPLVRKDFLDNLSEGQIGELWRIMTSSFPVEIDLFWLDRVPTSSCRIFSGFKPFSMTPLDHQAHALDLPDAPDWPSAARNIRSTRTIKKLERRIRGLAKLGELKLIEVSGNAARHKHLEELIDLKVSNLNDAGTLHRFDRADIRAFFSRLVDNTENDEDLLQFELRCDEDLVASVLGMSHQGTFYYQVCAHNRDFAKYSPGVLLMYQLMSWSHDRGLKRFDMTIGDEPYKKDWANRSTELVTVSWPVTGAGKLLLTKRALVVNAKQLVRKSRLLTRLAMALLRK